MKNAWIKTLEVLKYVGLILGMILLIVIAVGLIILITPIALIWKIVVSFSPENRKRKGRDIASGTAQFFLAIAISIDKFGNVAFGGFFTNLLQINKVYRFGDTSETVSEVLGWSYKYDDLNKGGLLLRSFVNFADWTETDHCEAARLSAVRKAEEKMEASRKFRMHEPIINPL